MKVRHIVSLAVLTGFAWGANAQTMKPGLWEISQKMSLGGGSLGKEMAAAQEQMAKMPPEQRKMMEDMMAKQGISMGGSGPGSVSVKMCMTKEMVEKDEIPSGQGDCTSTKSPRVGNTMKINFSCTKPPSSGEGLITFTSADSYALKMAVTTTVKGQPQKVDMDGTGRWLGTDCGTVKPMVMPKK
jgi:hypothetical protein